MIAGNGTKKLFDKTVVRTRAKLAPKVATLGFFGVMLFVGIPLPVTGAWTGTLGAWVLGLDRKKSILAVSAGVAYVRNNRHHHNFYSVKALARCLSKSCD